MTYLEPAYYIAKDKKTIFQEKLKIDKKNTTINIHLRNAKCE